MGSTPKASKEGQESLPSANCVRRAQPNWTQGKITRKTARAGRVPPQTDACLLGLYETNNSAKRKLQKTAHLKQDNQHYHLAMLAVGRRRDRARDKLN